MHRGQHFAFGHWLVKPPNPQPCTHTHIYIYICKYIHYIHTQSKVSPGHIFTDHISRKPYLPTKHRTKDLTPKKQKSPPKLACFLHGRGLLPPVTVAHITQRRFTNPTLTLDAEKWPFSQLYALAGPHKGSLQFGALDFFCVRKKASACVG